VVSLHLAGPTSFGKAGDTIAFDLFDIESYFAGARLDIKAGKGAMQADTNIKFSAENQGAELLGASAKNPDVGQTLTITDWDMAFAGGSARTRTDPAQTSRSSAYKRPSYIDSRSCTLGDAKHTLAATTPLPAPAGART
jgi:hypothetical protein